MLTRRQFLASAAAAPVLAARPAAAADPFGGFTIAVQTYTYRNFNLEQTLKFLKGLGVTAAEFYSKHVPVTASDAQIQRIRALCAEYGVIPVAFGVVSFTTDDAANEKVFRFASKLGVKYLSADPAPGSLESLDKLVARYDIPVAIHPHGPTGKGKELHRWSSAEVILDAVKTHDARIGSCLDTGHLIRTAQVAAPLDPAQQVQVMGKRNFGLHLKDHDNKRKTDVPFGDATGVLDVPGVLAALKAVGFTGYVAVEYEANPDDPTPDVAKCLAAIQSAVKKLG